MSKDWRNQVEEHTQGMDKKTDSNLVVSTKHRLKFMTPEGEALKQEMSKRSKEQWEDPDVRQRRLEGLKKAQAEETEEFKKAKGEKIRQAKLENHPTKGTHLSKEWREKSGAAVKETFKKEGTVSGICRTVSTPKGEFESVKDAYTALGISEGTLRKRLKDDTNTEYFYTNKEKQSPITRKNKMKPLMTPDGAFESTKAATAHYGYKWAENCTHKIKKGHEGWYWITAEEYEEWVKNNK